MIEFSELATYAGASGIGGGSVGGLCYFLIQRLFKRQERLEDESQRLGAELLKLRDDRVRTLETQLCKLQESVGESELDAAKRASDLSNLIGWMKKVDTKLDEVKDSTVKSQEAIKGQGVWLENIDSSLQAHLMNYEIHSTKKRG